MKKGNVMQQISFNLNKFKNKRVVVFGDFMVDEYLGGNVTRVSPEAPVPVVHVQSRSKRLGGAGNVVLNLCALGASVNSISYIGSDFEGNWLIERLKNFSVDTSGIMQSSDTVTSIKTRVTAQNQQLLRYDSEIVRDAPAAFEDFLTAKSEELLRGARAVIISDYGKGAVTKNTAKIIISAARQIGIPVMVDPKGSDYSKYSGATVVTPNMKELCGAVGRNLSSEKEIAKAGVELCKTCGIEYVLATRSEKGMSLICGNNGDKKDYPALAKEVVDVTGAGDTVISVFTMCFALGASHDDCCRLANIAASVVVSKFGAATASPREIYDVINSASGGYKKLISESEAAETAERLRADGKRIVFTNGCFDIIHAGHISSFKQARAFGDVLFVGLNSDSSIKRIKGEKRPIVTQNNRARVIEDMGVVDYVVIFDNDTPEELIRAIKPDVLIKGKDWEGKPVAGGDFVRDNGGEIRFIELEQGLSTTNVINKILEVYREE